MRPRNDDLGMKRTILDPSTHTYPLAQPGIFCPRSQGCSSLGSGSLLILLSLPAGAWVNGPRGIAVPHGQVTES